MTKTKEKEVVKTTPTGSAENAAPELTPKEQKEVRVIERVFENREVAPQDAFGKLTKSQLALIKTTIAKGASDDELRMFVQVCKGANLNPFLRQVHLVPRWDSKTGQEVRTIQVGIDGFRAVAESSGQYAGNDDPVYGESQTLKVGSEKFTKEIEAPTKATVTVYKLLEGQRYAFTATARWSEYYPGAKMGFQWHSRPFLMLGKCAEALALRKAFPKLLSGMYAQEEMEKTVQYESGAEKTQSGLRTLLNALKSDKVTLENLKEYSEKIQKSDKYTAPQKAEFLKAVELREVELKTVTAQ